MPVTSLALLFAAVASTNAAQATAPGQSPLAARSDGTWLVTEPIPEEPPPLASVTGGVLIDEEEWTEAREAAKGFAAAQTEAGVERAFEQAVDAARREPQR